MSPLPGDNNITCKIQRDHKLKTITVERKWKRVAEKGDNEGRETQIGQNNILVGRFV